MSAFTDKSGKVALSLFDDLFKNKFGKSRPEIIHGPEFGVDTSIVDLENGLGLVISSDPLTLIPSLGLKESAWLSVHLLVNDMVTSGFTPQYAQFIFNLSPEITKDQFQEYWHYIHEYCQEVGVAITGGHTGQAPGQTSTIAGGGTMFLTAPINKIVNSSGAQPGDSIIVTKQAALISSSILAKSFPNTVKKALGISSYKTAASQFFNTSVLRESQIAKATLEPNLELKAMHDATEGGILGAIDEMAKASGCGYIIENELLPTQNVSGEVCDIFNIDPRVCVGAGSMIIAVKEGTGHRLIEALDKANIEAKCVGSFTLASEGNAIIENGALTPFSFDGKDPYWDAYFDAIDKGLD